MVTNEPSVQPANIVKKADGPDNAFRYTDQPGRPVGVPVMTEMGKETSYNAAAKATQAIGATIAGK